MSPRNVFFVIYVIICLTNLTTSRNESLIDLETNEINGFYKEKAEKLLGETPERRQFALGKLREWFAGEIVFHKIFQTKLKNIFKF